MSKGARSWRLLDTTQGLCTCSDNVNVTNMDTSWLLTSYSGEPNQQEGSDFSGAASILSIIQ